MYQDNEIIFGIDFGTSNTVISYFFNNKSIVLSDGIYNSIPTKIGINNDNNIYCGNYIPLNIDNLIYNFKTLIGTNITFTDKLYTINDILLMFFNHIKKIIVKKFNNIKEFKTVISVPSNFNDIQREIIKNCFISVGFIILRIINEPSAAALAYGLNNVSDIEEKILVIDIGGGTFDITVLIKDNTFFQVEYSVGVNDLGGNNFTDIIYNYVLNLIINKEHINKNNLWYLCQKTKEKLTYLDEYEIKINNLIFTISKNKFEKISILLINKIEEQLFKINKNDIQKIILVGNSSKIPFLQKIIYDIFKIKPWIHPNLDAVVSYGACLYGAIIENIYNNNINKNVILIDVLPLSLGVETVDGAFSIIIPKNTPLPIKRSQKYTTDSPSDNTVKIKVYQGERKIAVKNTFIGEFIFDKITPSGTPIIDICFKVDLNGIINIIVTDKKSGIDKSILIKDLPKLNNDDIDLIINLANNTNNDDDIEILFKSRLYQINTKIEIIMNNIKINDKINDINKNDLFLQLENIDKKVNEINIVTEENNTLLLNIINEINDKFLLFTQNNSSIEDYEENTFDKLNIINELKNQLYNRLIILLNKNNEWKEYIDPIFEKLNENNITLEYIQDKLEIIKELEDDNTNDYKEQFNNLCLFIKSELENENIQLSSDKLKELNDFINFSINLIEKSENININWEEKLIELNNFCDKLTY